MEIDVHGFTAAGSIEVTIDGQRMTIPDDIANRHRQMLAEWESEGNTIPAYVPPPPSTGDVEAERDRRLAGGFDFDFGDERGTHRIGTTPADMVGWDDVTKLSNARLALGQTTAITIRTDTGVAEVTPLEWQHIVSAAGNFREPVWHGSFWLSEQDPVPADYATNPAYWAS